jgi:hypothetical protein
MERSMSHGDSLGDRGKALEEAFFARQGEEWRRQQREAAESQTRKQALSSASGITDDALLDKLEKLRLDAATLAALTMVPLVVVAWADGQLDDKERAALLAAAAEAGIDREGASYRSLTGWLAAPPSPNLLDAWTGYVRATSADLAPEARHALKADILSRATKVAEAAGGFLGLGRKVSSAEEAVLQKLERAFSP